MPITSQIQGVPSIGLPSPSPVGTNQVTNVRTDQYGNLTVNSRIPTKATLALEGVYFTGNNGAAGLATGATETAFVATTPFISIFNNGVVGSSAAPRIVLDYITLIATAAGTNGTALICALVLDVGNRITTAGTVITPIKCNSTGPSSVASITCGGGITAAAATPQARTVIGTRYLKGAIPVAGDNTTLQFGSVDSSGSLQVATITASLQHAPSVVINPGEQALFYIWLPAQSGASSFAPEIGWYEI